MFILTPEKLSLARLAFSQSDFGSPESGDRFFEAFGVGNLLNNTDRPFERFCDYEELLSCIQADDVDKFKTIHKGTAYYFMAWTSFIIKYYKKALFYMDAAISEDIRKTVNQYKNEHSTVSKSNDDLTKDLLFSWIKNPSGIFITLDNGTNSPTKNVISDLRIEIETEISRFGDITGNTYSFDDFIDNFILKLAEASETRSIITTIYTFILEVKEIKDILALRSSYGGSLEPILEHLFKGGLIFESLLKYYYPVKDNGKLAKTIGDVFNCTEFKNKYGNSFRTSASTLEEIINLIEDDSLNTAFNTVARIRNTTGHNLKWHDIFNDVNIYMKLYRQIINAILFIFSKECIHEENRPRHPSSGDIG